MPKAIFIDGKLVGTEWTGKDLACWKDPDAGKIRVEDGCYVLDFGHKYFIETDRIKSKDDLLEWTHHLCEKNWMKANRISLFIDVVATHKGWNIYQHS